MSATNSISCRRFGVLLGYYQLGGEQPHSELMDLFLEPTTRDANGPQRWSPRSSAVRSMSTFRMPSRSLDDGLGAIIWEAHAVNVDPAAQRRLLDLAAVDAELTRAAHRRRSLPELVEVEQAEKSLQSARDSLVAAETAVSDLDRDIHKLEAEIEQVRTREDRDRGLLDSGSISSGKQLEDLQHELATLRRRQTVLEDELLDVMEQREATAADLERGRVVLIDIEQRRLDAVRRRDEALAEVGSTEERGAQERRILIGELPADLVSLYERIRARNGTGAALVREGRCGACRLELDRTAIGHLREAASDEVVRCEECGVVLVRTPESGLSTPSDLSAESGR